MSHLRTNRTGILFFALLGIADSVPFCNAAQPPAAQTELQEQPLPIQQQPADDAVPELKDPVESQDPKKIEARAAYMEGIAAQKDGNLTDAIKAFVRAAAADPTAPEPVRAHAILLRRLGRATQAEVMARKAIELDPDDYEMRLELAGMLLAQRKPQEATALIEGALESKTLDKKSAAYVSLHSIRGRIHLLTQDAAKAAESFGVILDALQKPEDFGLDFRQHQALLSDSITGYEPVGRIMLQTGNNDKAIVAFKALIGINENKPGDDHYWLALAEYRKDLLDDAEKNLNRYFESNRRSRPALELLTDIYEAKSQGDQLEKKLVDLNQNTTDSDAVNMFLGDLLVDKGEGDKAAKVYQDVIANSGNADAYIGLIRVDVLNRDATSLMSSVNKALKARIQRQELVPLIERIAQNEEFAKTLVTTVADDSVEQRPDAIFFYSQIADALKLYDAEGKLLQATLEKNPDPRLRIEAISQLGMNQYSRDKYIEAANTFRQMLAIQELPDNERVMTLYRLSVVEGRNENFENAIEAIQSAIRFAPQSPLLVNQLGLLQLQADQPEKAEVTLKSAIKLSEGDPKLESDSRILLGGLYSQLGRWKDAIATYTELLEMPELSQETARRGRMALSNAHVQNGDMVNGEKILQAVYAQDPENPGVNNDLGYLYAEQNKNLEQAEKMIRIAVDAEPDNKAYLDSLGWVLYRRGKHEEAEKVLEKANSDPDYRDSTIIEHLGDVQQALKKSTQATETWQEALDEENKSDSPDKEIVKRLTDKIGSANAEPDR